MSITKVRHIIFHHFENSTMSKEEFEILKQYNTKNPYNILFNIDISKNEEFYKMTMEVYGRMYINKGVYTIHQSHFSFLNDLQHSVLTFKDEEDIRRRIVWYGIIER